MIDLIETYYMVEIRPIWPTFYYYDYYYYFFFGEDICRTYIWY